MAVNLDSSTIANNLDQLGSLLKGFKVPYFSTLVAGINSAEEALKIANADVDNVLATLDQQIDGIAGNNFVGSGNSLALNFGKTLNSNFGSGLPSVSADFSLAWSLNNSSTQTAVFSNLKLNSLFGKDSFVTNILGQVKTALKPIKPLIGALERNINLFTNEFPDGFQQSKDSLLDPDKDGKITVLDILQVANKFAPPEYGINPTSLNTLVKFVQETNSVLELAETVEKVGSKPIPLTGSFIYDSSKQLFLPSGTSNAEIDDSSLKTALGKLSNFNLNILNPEASFNLFLGKPDVDLFTYTLPKVSFKSPIGLKEAIQIPIVIPLLNATLGVKFDASIDLGFGFDTRGINNLQNNPTDAFNGFYVLDVNGKLNPEIRLDGAFSFGLKLGNDSLGAAVRGGANIGVEAGFFLATNQNGKLYFSDIQPDNLFGEIKGQVYAELEASADLNIGGALKSAVEQGVLGQVKLASAATGYLRKITKEAGILGEGFELLDKGVGAVKKVAESTWNFVTGGGDDEPSGSSTVLFEVKTPRQELWSFGISKQGSSDTEIPILATPAGDQLLLNIGTRAQERKYGDVEDKGEVFTVGTSNGLLQVSAFGYTQPYSVLAQIVAIAGNGNDLVTIDASVSAKLDGGVGNDKLYGGSQNDTLDGGENDDYLEGRAGVDLLFGRSGNDSLKGGDGNDELFGGSDSDRLYGDAGGDALFGEDGLDYLYGGIGNDSLNGGNQNDELFGDVGQDTLRGGNGNDYLDGGLENDWLYGDDGQDILWGGDGNDYLNGGLKNDLLLGEAGNDTLEGGQGSDLLSGDVGSDFLSGGSGDDYLYGDADEDTLLGESGNDLIDGGSEADVVSYVTSPSSAIVNIDETSSYNNVAYPFDLEPSFTIAAGTALDGFGNTDTLRNLENITGSNYSDVLIGNALSNILNGLAGNDLLVGNGGDDTLDGGDGIDTVSYRRSSNSSNIGVSVDLSQGTGFDGIDGLDTLRNVENIIGSRFADRLTGNSQANTILGGDGNDIIDGKEGSDRLFGENGNDEIFGGSGDDYLVGGTGSGWFSDILDGGSGNDTASYITAASGVAASLAERTGWQGDATGDKFISIENLEGSFYNDTLVGDGGNNILSGLAGNDNLEGRAGNDTLEGGSGNDALWGNDGNDVLNGGDGIDTLVGDLGNDSLDGGKGNDRLEGGLGNDILQDLDGDNRLDAGEGNNIIRAGSGNDTIISGPGNDVIDAGNGNNDIRAGEGVNQITAGSGNDVIYGGASRDVIFSGAGNDQIFAAEGANTIDAGSGNDKIYAGAGDDLIYGGLGDDTISAADGNNTIYGGAGQNTITGGSGRDLFVLAFGGSNTINQFNLGKDLLGLSGGLSFGQLAIAKKSKNGESFTEVSIAGTSNVLAILKGVKASSLTSAAFSVV